jgi:hypothetical protein
VLVLGFSFWAYATFAISWLYVLLSPFIAIALVFSALLINRNVLELLKERIQQDEEFARHALLMNWVTVCSTDK